MAFPKSAKKATVKMSKRMTASRAAKNHIEEIRRPIDRRPPPPRSQKSNSMFILLDLH